MNQHNLTEQEAIRTRYYSPTDTMGSRFIATDGENRVTVPYDDALNTIENHAAAAKQFLRKYNCFESRLVENAFYLPFLRGFEFDCFWTWEVDYENVNPECVCCDRSLTHTTYAWAEKIATGLTDRDNKENTNVKS